MVAIKVLPQEVATDPGRLAPLRPEARAASAISDPHLVTVFGVGESESFSYIATEFVMGTTLVGFR